MASRVLIADDHEMVRRGIRTLLESFHRDIQVLEASNGREAVEKAIGLKPDLVILDVSMPLLDGFSAAREIRKVAAGTPILILTFEKSRALTEMAKSIGVNGFITKDEDAHTLLRAVDAAMGNRTDEEPDGHIRPRSQNAQMEEHAVRSHILAVTSPVVRVLLLHSQSAYAERCLEEFGELQFRIDADVVMTSEQCTERLKSRSYDILLAEYPIAPQQQTPTPELLRLAGRNIPLIFVAHKIEPATAADLIAKGAADCVGMDNPGQLPVAILRAFNENTLRAERNRAEKRLQRTEAHYQALMRNSAFGVCRCGMQGQFMDVNWALVSMLGCESKEELLGSGLAAEILHDPSNRAQLLGQVGEDGRADPLEIAWGRKDGTSLRSEEHTSELQSRPHLVCRLLLEKKKTQYPAPDNLKKKHRHTAIEAVRA